MTAAASRPTKWSDDAFLDRLRDLGDALADQCAADLPREEKLQFLFSKMRTDADLPTVLPPAFEAFLSRATPSLALGDLTAADQARLERGQQVLMTNALPTVLVLLTKSLQEGYQSPRLGKVLLMGGGLERATYRRILGVLQMLLQVCTPGSYKPPRPTARLPFSDAALMAVKVRLMHAGMRGVAHRKMPEFSATYGGQPISLEDMLATLMGFSSLVMDGFDELRVPLSAEDAEDYYFVWKVYARTMGIHPPGEQSSWEFVPETLAEAREFYASYQRRHYKPLAENADGATLAAANLRMLNTKMPPLVARIYMHKLMGKDACRELGVRAVPLMFLTKWVLFNFPRIWMAVWRVIDRRTDGARKHADLTERLLQRLIVIEYKDGVPSLSVPRDIEDIHEVVRGMQPGGTTGREQFATEVFPKELEDIRARRAKLGLDTTALEGGPSSERGLVGLALSGGGIRSATFALGVTQAMARRDALRAVDYLSTVSGGGYTGGALSTVLNDAGAGLGGHSTPGEPAFPFDYEPGAIEPPAVRHIRNGGSYLTGGGLLDQVRLPAILLRGLLLNALLVLPYVMLLALVTFILFPTVQAFKAPERLVYAALAVFLALVLSYPALTWLFGRRRTWAQRNRSENSQIIALIVLVGAVVLALAETPVNDAITSDWTAIKAWISKELSDPLEARDFWKWGLVALVALASVRVGKVSTELSSRMSQLFVYVIGLVGPALVFGAYLLNLVLVVRSPYLPEHHKRELDSLRVAVLGEGTSADPRCSFAAACLDSAALAARSGQLGVSDEFKADLLTRGIDLKGDLAFVTYEATDSLAWNLWDWSMPRFDPVLGTLHIPDASTVPSYRITEHQGFLMLHGVEFGTQAGDWWFAGAAVLLFVLNGLLLNVNITSPHGFWRDRLSRAFLFRARPVGVPVQQDDQKLSDLGTANPGVPYHLLNTSLNLAGSRVEDLPGRSSDFFLFSKRYVGSYATGYCETRAIEEADPHLNLGTAMAISAAAASPNMGTTTIKPLVFALTLLNVRLGYWVPNPWYVQAPSLVRRLMVKTKPGPWFLMREAVGALHARGAFVNVSDGGHIENLAAYELLRRRCRLVVVSDAEADPDMSCPSLNTLIRYARVDLGVEIDIDLSPLRPDATGHTARHWVIGIIRYGPDDHGYLLYVKSSVTGDEPPYVLDYRGRHPTFPQQSTTDQTFDEAQFESYRALGYHAMNSALKSIAGLARGADAVAESEPGVAALRRGLNLKAERFTGRLRAVDV